MIPFATMQSKQGGPGRYRRTTLRDVAAAAGVDVSTVSKVLNDNSQINVRPATRERIMAAADELRYRPDPVARSLRYGHSGALGMLFPDLTNPVYGLIMRGAAQRAGELGYAILLAELGDENTPSSYERLVEEHRIDGLVIATSRDNSDVLEKLPAAAPHVYANRRARGAGPSVIVDDEAAGSLAAQSLLAAGHTRLAFIGDSDETDTARRRRLGFVNACRKAAVPDPVDILTPYTRAGGFGAMETLLDLDHVPTGAFASSLLVGIGSLAAARERNVTVPDDLSLVTLDAEDAEYSAPPLSAIRLPLREMGAAAVEMIDRVIRGEPSSDLVVPIPPSLIERDSIGPPPNQDPRDDVTA